MHRAMLNMPTWVGGQKIGIYKNCQKGIIGLLDRIIKYTYTVTAAIMAEWLRR